MPKAHFVQHTHWDREWYFTTSDALVLSDQVFTEMLDELTRNEKVNFTLDGQSSIIDEYVEIHPEKIEVIRKLVRENKLFVGPWYTQTDALLVDAESILRNLIIGINETSLKYGNPMMLGYLPDTFGFNAQLPTILQHAGIDNFLSWRGLNFEKLVESPYFVWKGLGNKKVYAVNFPFGYMTGLLYTDALDDLTEFVNDRLDPAIEFNSIHGNNDDILIPSGIDQKSMVENFDDVVQNINKISKYENVISDYPTFVNIIRNKENLPSYKGELREPVYSRIHRSIGSVRTQIKLENYKLEQKLIRRVEPLLAIAKGLGITIGKGLLVKAWKKLLENQAHDSIGGCVSDNVAVDIHHRFKQANELADGIENLVAKRIAEFLNLKENEIIVFNTDAKPFNGNKVVHVVAPDKNIKFENGLSPILVGEKYYPARQNIKREIPKGHIFIDEPPYYELDIQINIDLPALGYKVIRFETSDHELQSRTVSQDSDYAYIENEYYKVKFSEDAIELQSLKDKSISRISIVDCANDGDTYDFSPLLGDEEKLFTFNSAKVSELGNTKTMEIFGEMNLPYDLPDRLSENPNYGDLKVKLTLNLSNGSDLIRGNIHINNKILSHRLRLQISELNNDQKSIAQIQNGFIENTVEEISEDWNKSYVEKPVNIKIFDKTVSVQNVDNYFTFFGEGLKEYERIDDSLFITLMSTTGELGKPDLAWRPGRASGDTTNEGHIMMPTPMAQELGENSFSFALRVGQGKFDETIIAKIAQDWVSPSVSYQRQMLNKFINRLDNKIWPLQSSNKLELEYSLFSVPENLIVSSIYPSYSNEDSFIVRLSNPTKETITLDNEFLKGAKVVNAIEKELAETDTILPYDFVTLMYQYTPN
ncbi:alpha-mannosidase [Aerococcus agrisoli]|uniref:Alpha-mannosidase n=1 Tax=Aerococcus agrisoli TaxID=2487350 RepID=A0A3N4GSZ2_9LACT|nr:alpha-mannosidase [Aerococcus agrisoli]RPA65425.1 alpha-mannosidase [Aerococcus agrisoli]